jgi:hypothetical protein
VPALPLPGAFLVVQVVPDRQDEGGHRRVLVLRNHRSDRSDPDMNHDEEIIGGISRLELASKYMAYIVGDSNSRDIQLSAKEMQDIENAIYRALISERVRTGK